MENAYAVSIDQVIQDLQTDEKRGLDDKEASARLVKYGKNDIPPPPPTSFLVLVAKQFEDALVLILLAAACISFVLALFEHPEERLTAFMEPAVILVILICNATVGVLQETNAEKAIEKLKEMDASEARVIRGGVTKIIPASDLVPGDLVVLAAGDKSPADLRLLSGNISMNEASLTGETDDQLKSPGAIRVDNAVDQDKKNIIFRSTLATKGSCSGIVVLTGAQTSVGHIQSGLQQEDEVRTPLQHKLDEFGELLSKVIGVICVTVWLINWRHFTDPEYGGVVNGAVYYFKIAVALAVAAIPEGLPAVVTTCLALGTMKMARKHAIVRSLPSVETLGCTTVICSDKTGTLTTGKMTVEKILIAKDLDKLFELDVTGKGWSPTGTIVDSRRILESPCSIPALQKLSQISCLCNDARLEYKNGDFSRVGEATEAALKVLSEKIGFPDKTAKEMKSKNDNPEHSCHAAHNFWSSTFPRVHTLDFEESRMSMGVVVSEPSGKSSSLLVKGAPDSVISRCTKIQLADGTIKPLSDADRSRFSSYVRNNFSNKGLRCLALAYKDDVRHSDAEYKNASSHVKIESDLVLVGVAGMMDPPRAEVKDAIFLCHRAGIRVIVITGDDLVTATSICRMIGVFAEDEDVSDKAFIGRDLIEMSEKQQAEAVKHANLFARVQPMHKQKLVDLLQKQEEVVAMTGDGVNDAPALKRADIGIAMGSGTAVAKEASKMILQDDNFATIVMAVEQGRAIYTNTKQFIRYLISSNIGEVVCIFTTAAFGMPEALIPVQLLWVNLVTDGLPATALSFNPPEPDIMSHPPRGRTERIVDGWLFTRYLITGTYIGLATVFGSVWWFLFYQGGPQLTFEQLTHFGSCGPSNTLFSGVDCEIFNNYHPSTVALSVLVTIEMFNTCNALSENLSILAVPPWTNPWVIIAIFTSFMLHFVILYVPFFGSLFKVAPLNSAEWTAVVAISFPVILIDEIMKFVGRRLRASQEQERIAKQKKLK